MHVGDYLGRRTLYTPDRLAIVDHGKTPALRLTFRELNTRANRLANWLRAEGGVARGDRVAILARDGVEHLIAFYACGKLGAIHTPLNWRLHWRENAAILEHVTARGLIFGDDFQSQAGEIVAELRAGPAALGFLLHLDGPGLPGSLWFDTALAQASDSPVTCEALDLEDIACLLFTGGTTGLPKGAMISHRQINWNSLNTVIHDLTHGDVYLNVFPLFHAGGLFTYLATQVTFGNATHLVRQFDAAQVLALLEREAITVFAAVPTMYQMLTQAPNWEKADLSRLRFCTSGGAPLPVPLIERYVAEKGVKFKQGFGMTEFGPGLFALAPEDAVRKAGSIGRPNFFVDVRVVDDLGEALGPDQPGELVLRGPSGCSGYYNDPEASRAAIDAGGWFHTGDIVRYDDEGYFFVLDRKKDMFISGGENVYPAEVEAALYRHAAVLQCAVVGVPDPQWGEVGVAAVVLKPGAQASADELVTHLRGQLARYKVPRQVELLEALPLSGMGKILKRELRRTYSPAHLAESCQRSVFEDQKSAIRNQKSTITGVSMPTVPTLPGITSRLIDTPRLKQHVLFSGPEGGIPVVFIHGNFSAATYWEELMLSMPPQYRCIAPDLRGYGDTEDKVIDGTRGARDWADDLKALSDSLGTKAAHMVGWSAGGGAILQFALDDPELVASLTLVAPVSPYGFGGTKGLDGTPSYVDCAGSGGGTVNPEFVKRIQAGDRSAEDPNSPRNVINAFYYKAPFKAAREEAFLEAALLEKTGTDKYPGDLTPSANWPNVAPGTLGPINALSPKYFNASGIVDLAQKPPVLWVRGDSDQIVGDASFFDFGTLGQLGFVPGWPGADVFPPQPMVGQTRAVLETYQANGGAFKEVVIADAGHSPHLEKPTEFLAAFTAFLAAA